MIVDLILKTGVAPGVCALLPLEHDRATVRQDQPGPHQQYPRLAERDLAVIGTDQASPLGDQTGAASWGVIDIFGNLRGDLSGKIRADACDESGRDTATSRLIGGDADEAGALVGGLHRTLGQNAPDLIRLVVARFVDIFPDL